MARIPKTVLDDEAIATLMDDADLLMALPCLKAAKQSIDSIKPGNPNCELCQRQKRAIKVNALIAAKNCVKGSGEKMIERLKEKFNADKLEILIPTSNGQSVRYIL